jgi:hypothetical protein
MDHDSQILERLKLSRLGFVSARFFSEDHWAAVIQEGSFAHIVDGDEDALSIGYRNKWTYRSLSSALNSLKAWDGQSEPTGWLIRKIDHEAMTVWP